MDYEDNTGKLLWEKVRKVVMDNYFVALHKRGSNSRRKTSSIAMEDHKYTIG